MHACNSIYNLPPHHTAKAVICYFNIQNKFYYATSLKIRERLLLSLLIQSLSYFILFILYSINLEESKYTKYLT